MGLFQYQKFGEKTLKIQMENIIKIKNRTKVGLSPSKTIFFI